jgi:hypothetical protein
VVVVLVDSHMEAAEVLADTYLDQHQLQLEHM